MWWMQVKWRPSYPDSCDASHDGHPPKQDMQDTCQFALFDTCNTSITVPTVCSKVERFEEKSHAAAAHVAKDNEDKSRM